MLRLSAEGGHTAALGPCFGATPSVRSSEQGTQRRAQIREGVSLICRLASQVSFGGRKDDLSEIQRRRPRSGVCKKEMLKHCGAGVRG